MPKLDEIKNEVLVSEVTLKVKDKSTAEAMKVYDSKMFSETKRELKFNKKSSPKTGNFWRLIHDGLEVKMLFEAEGETQTAFEMFCGTLEECRKEIEILGLKDKK